MSIIGAPYTTGEVLGPGSNESLVTSDEIFVQRITNAALEAQKHYPGLPVTVLFDVEYTIGEPDFEQGTDIRVRPGFYAAVNSLDQHLGTGWDLGICTTRAQETLAAELLAPTYLRGVTHKVRDTQYLIGSTSKLEQYDAELNWLDHHATPTEVCEALCDILSPAVRDATLNGQLDPAVWYDPKLVVVQRKAKERPDRVFILIDDLLAAAAIGPDRTDPDHSKVIGVCVNEHRNLRREVGLLNRQRCLELGEAALEFL
jgi:hypothetical protein